MCQCASLTCYHLTRARYLILFKMMTHLIHDTRDTPHVFRTRPSCSGKYFNMFLSRPSIRHLLNVSLIWIHLKYWWCLLSRSRPSSLICMRVSIRDRVWVSWNYDGSSLSGLPPDNDENIHFFMFPHSSQHCKMDHNVWGLKKLFTETK